MRQKLIDALSEFKGTKICYTGGRYCGKTTLASVFTLSALDDDQHSVATLDLCKDRALESISYDAGIPTIDLDTIKSEALAETLNQYDYLVIDLELSETLPDDLGLITLDRGEVVSSYKSWYIGLFTAMTQTLVALPVVDDQGHADTALDFLANLEIGFNSINLGYFKLYPRNSHKAKWPWDDRLEQLVMREFAPPITFTDHNLEIIQSALDGYSQSCSPEFWAHFESVFYPGEVPMAVMQQEISRILTR